MMKNKHEGFADILDFSEIVDTDHGIYECDHSF